MLLVPQSKNNPRNHDFSGTALLSINGVFTLGRTDYKNVKIGFGALGMAEYFIPAYSPAILGVRLLVGGQTVSGEDTFKDPNEFITDMYIAGGGLTIGYTFDNEFFPYIYGGVSNLWFNPKDKDGKKLENNSKGVYSRTAISWDLEIGSRIVLRERFSIFFSAGAHFVQTDNLDDITIGTGKDFYYSGQIGVSFSFFGEEDSDGDGVNDSEDPCPSNAEDYDGFQDDDGCPDNDNDKDKIFDAKDKCPDDPEDKDGFKDDDGCPDPDNDGDGILDKDDNCPNEPENFNGYEDSDGCPDILSNLQNIQDTDKDGFLDEVDKCPNQAETFNAFEDDDGCPDSITIVDTTTVKQMTIDTAAVKEIAIDTATVKEIVLNAVNLFDYRGTELKPTANAELDQVFSHLEKDPFIKWMVESYTDNNGKPDSLKNLSQKRAVSVVRYLIDKGLPSFMFKISAKGSESPIADNKFLEGRMKNNRIVIRRIE
jgi:outer membrane protein OmpA-like peptidoglycan-associated protein